MKASLIVVPPIGAAVIGALGATWRFRVRGRENVEEARRAHDRIVFAFWHGRMLPLVYLHRGQDARVLASEHHDGELIARTLRFLGYRQVRGSSTRGGTKAILGLADAVHAGHDIGITVDGPRGPRYQVKPGVVELAKLTGAAVVPVTSASRRHKTFASWDAFELPSPFTRVEIEYGAPIRVAPDADRPEQEEKRREVEASLARITASCDRAAGA